MLTREVEKLRTIAKAIRPRDPLGAAFLRSLANRIESGKCERCFTSYSDGYNSGYHAGLKSPAGPVQATDASPARESDHAGL